MTKQSEILSQNEASESIFDWFKKIAPQIQHDLVPINNRLKALKIMFSSGTQDL